MTVARQYLTALIVGIAFFYTGCVYGWIPSVLVRLVKEGRLSSSEGSWAVSLTHLGSLLVAVPSGLLSVRIGRKPILLSSAPVYLLCWLVAFFTTSPAVLFAIRIFQGMAMGMLFSTAPVLVGEMAEPRIRGTLGALGGAMWGLGVAYEYALAPFLDYSALIWVNIPFPIIFLLTFIWIPDSPYSLLLRGRNAEAGQALAWFRGKSEAEEVSEELAAMKKSVSRELEEAASWKDVLGTPEGRRSVGIMLLVIGTLVLGGSMSILVYAGQSLSRIAGASEAWSRAGPVVVSLVSIAGPLLVGSAVDRLGRRPLLVVTLLGSSLCCLGAGVYYYLDDRAQSYSARITWLPYVSLVLAALLQGMATGMTFPLRAELFPSSTRGIAAGIVSSTITITSFSSIKLFQVITDHVGLYLNFFIYSFVGFVGSVLIYFVVPETKGKTFDEIQKILK